MNCTPDDSPHDELSALSAARREEDVEVVLAVLPPLELVEHPVRERPEALRATARDGYMLTNI